MVGLLIFAAAAATQPSPEALKLGREIAEGGTMASFIELVQSKETDELVDAHPEISTADKVKLRATAHRVYLSGRERLMAATGRAYAERLGVDDLREIATFQRSRAGQSYRASIRRSSPRRWKPLETWISKATCSPLIARIRASCAANDLVALEAFERLQPCTEWRRSG